MFTGIVSAKGSVIGLQELEAEWRMSLHVGELDLGDVKIGDSIAVNGCCLTVVVLDSDGSEFAADVSNETLRCTTLGELKTGSSVNLEKAMLASDRFGGHIVSGHVDGVGELLSITPEGKSQRLNFRAPDALAKYIAAKGSICIDGTSLTVNAVEGATFSINVIPHTQLETISGSYVVGQRVNLEVDLVARYLERLTSAESTPSLDRNFLQDNGFKAE